MEKLILVVHVLTALSIIGLIMMQQGKGAEAGASFGGGASQTVFGGQGSGNFFTRATAVLAAVFFVTSFGLAIVAKQQARISGLEGMPVTEQVVDLPQMIKASVDADVPVETGVVDSASELPQ